MLCASCGWSSFLVAQAGNVVLSADKRSDTAVATKDRKHIFIVAHNRRF